MVPPTYQEVLGTMRTLWWTKPVEPGIEHVRVYRLMRGSGLLTVSKNQHGMMRACYMGLPLDEVRLRKPSWAYAETRLGSWSLQNDIAQQLLTAQEGVRTLWVP